MSGGATWLMKRTRGRVGAPEAGVGEQLLVQRRERAEHVRDALLDDLLDRGVDLEVDHRHEARAGPKRRRQRQDRAQVEHRQRIPPDVLLGQREAGVDRVAGADDRLVRQRAALRLGGRAGRVHHDRRVADADSLRPASQTTLAGTERVPRRRTRPGRGTRRASARPSITQARSAGVASSSSAAGSACGRRDRGGPRRAGRRSRSRA